MEGAYGEGALKPIVCFSTSHPLGVIVVVSVGVGVGVGVGIDIDIVNKS